jgi:hypothetical protein
MMIEKVTESFRSKGAGDNETRIKDLTKKAAILAGKLSELANEEKATQEKLATSNRGKIKAAQVHRGATLCVGSLRQIVSELITDLYLFQPVEKKA